MDNELDVDPPQENKEVEERNADPSQENKTRNKEMDNELDVDPPQEKKEVEERNADPSQENKTSVNVADCSSSSAPQLDGLRSSISRSPGWKWIFKPTDLEIVTHFLPMKVSNPLVQCRPIIELNLYQEDPLEIHEKYKEQTVEGDLYFFTKRQRKYPNGDRPARAVLDGKGKWKISGDATEICKAAGEPQIGARRYLEYYIVSKKPEASDMFEKHTPSDNTGLRIDDSCSETKTQKKRRPAKDVAGISKKHKASGKGKKLKSSEEHKTNIRMYEYVLETTTNKQDKDKSVEKKKKDKDLPKDGPSGSKKMFHEWALCRLKVKKEKPGKVANPKQGPAVGTGAAGEENDELPAFELAASGEENVLVASEFGATSEENVEVPPVEPAAAGKGNAGRLAWDLNKPYNP